MIRGHLKILVLTVLSDKAMSGYELMSNIKNHIGNKPSPGSIYPLLDSLKEARLVKCENIGRKKEYSITASGKKYLMDIQDKKKLIIDKLSEGFNLLEQICKIQPGSFYHSVFEDFKQGKIPFYALETEISEFRESLIPFSYDKKNSKKAKNILKQATKKIKELK